AAGEGFVAPRTETERVVAGFWTELLRVPRVGVHDRFFDIGGHSLLGTQLMSRLRDAFGVELAVRTLFEADTVAALAERVEAAMPVGGGARLTRSAGARPPLSFAQERLWFLDRLQPGSALYNVHAALRLSGELSFAALRASLQEIVDRHAALRTTFPVAGEEPEVAIAPALDLALPVVDLAALASAARESEEDRLLVAAACRPFDLASGPLLRAVLLRDGASDWVLALTLHHIVCDGWSLGILVRESLAVYAARCRGEASPRPAGSAGTGGSAGLTPVAFQYADFARWQRGWLSGAVLAEQVAYWREALADPPALLSLPTDRPRPRVQGVDGGRVPVAIPPQLTAALHQLARQSGATLYMVALAALQALLFRHSGDEDLLVGSPVANRTRSELEGVVGLFVNTLVLRGRPSGATPFVRLLADVRATVLGAYSHQDLPFERLVDELRVERSLAHNPLFQVLLVLQNAPSAELALPGLRLAPRPVATGTAKFDLSLDLTESAELGIVGFLEYARDLFTPVTVARLLGHFLALLEDAARAPATPLAELTLTSEAERHQLLVEWSAEAAIRPTDASGGPVPIGVVGELWTAEGTGEERRFRRTGARARLRADGSVELLGAGSRQVRVRGYRIDLDAVEAALLRLPEITRAAALAVDDASGRRSLVAFVVLRDAEGDPRQRLGELQDRLAEEVADYLVPSALVALAALPLTADGALDREALAGLAMREEGFAPRFVAPQSPTERRLAEIWRDLLRLSRVGIEDRFFDLGGDSLLATRLVARVKLEFALEIPVRTLFEAPTIAKLAARLEGLRATALDAAIPPLRRVPRPPVLPLSFAQER
ncbi:MAG TPA: condensation domain-containing protein, partial [Thermoanaerobaculia bacterium]